MLTRLVVSASLAVCLASQAPAMLASGKEPRPSASQPVSQSLPIADVNRVTLISGRDGHFNGQFVINGHHIDGVIDTGATFVALNAATASDIGIHPDDLAYDYMVTTAAGDITAARVVLESLSLGNVSLQNVEALVVRGDTLPSVLIGMSFLGKLTSYAVAGNTMRLAQ